MSLIAAVADEALDRVRANAPPGVRVRSVDEGLDGVAFFVPAWESRVALAGLPELRVVQVLSAGTEWIEEAIPPGVTLCNGRGTRDVPVAEWALGALLGASSGTLAAARDRRWDLRPPWELAGSDVVVLGHGSIGRALGVRLEALGARVHPVASRPRDGVQGPAALGDLLPVADAVVVLTPLTAATRGMVDAAFLARMRDGALLVNAGRGAVVDTGALLAELAVPRLQAVLDVVDPEPLPAGHPLWDAPGLLALTAHQAGSSPASDERAAQLAARNLARFAGGLALENVVRGAARPR